MQTNQKLTLLRAEMAAEGIDAFIVSNADPHHNEYVADRWRSRAWLAGMKGSAGTVVVTAEWAGLWTDSRYYEAAEDALADSEIELIRMSDIGVNPIDVWLKSNLTKGQTVGFNGADTDLKQARNWVKSFEQALLKTRTDLDLVDIIWEDRPAAPKGELFLVEDTYTGQTIEDKITAVREKMQSVGVEAYLLGRTDESCWLLNFRGTDIEASPTPYCYTLITEDAVNFYVDPDKLTPAATAKFEAAGITIKAYDSIVQDLQQLDASNRVLVVPNYISYQLSEAVKHCLQIESRPIVTDLKAVKNATEVAHLKKALIDDGAAIVKFYTWLYSSLNKGETVTELSASRKLEACRAEFDGYRHVSFESIMGYAADGALNHYSVDEESDKPVLPENIFLIDSGGNFVHGTTDTTRTIPMGEPTQEQKEDYTVVLHALLDLLMLEFAEGSTGAQLDGICRQSLWKHGKNFKHGTGHGVGFGLEVHEGPQNISGTSIEKMKLGMITTIEPGCYRSGSHGIRIENMVHTVLSQETEFGKFFKFENLTFCPINTDLIDRTILPQHQIDWLNNYHAEILEKLSPLLNEEEQAWLKHECRPML
ncbi:MAG: aminopeptidase P family N-terminal domain-containing protein [Akkermansiaceae bacterium]